MLKMAPDMRYNSSLQLLATLVETRLYHPVSLSQEES